MTVRLIALVSIVSLAAGCSTPTHTIGIGAGNTHPVAYRNGNPYLKSEQANSVVAIILIPTIGEPLNPGGIMLTVVNNGSSDFDFGPESVRLFSGSGALAPLTDAKLTDVSLAPMDTYPERVRLASQLTTMTLKRNTVSPGQKVGGVMFLPKSTPVGPLKVQVSLPNDLHEFLFDVR